MKALSAGTQQPASWPTTIRSDDDLQAARSPLCVAWLKGTNHWLDRTNPRTGSIRLRSGEPHSVLTISSSEKANRHCQKRASGAASANPSRCIPKLYRHAGSWHPNKERVPTPLPLRFPRAKSPERASGGGSGAVDCHLADRQPKRIS